MTNEKGYHLALRNYALSLAKINEELDHRELIEPHMHATQILAIDFPEDLEERFLTMDDIALQIAETYEVDYSQVADDTMEAVFELAISMAMSQTQQYLN